MSFLVGDTQQQRHDRIRSYIRRREHVIAALLAAADFEWTVRRVILAFSRQPNTKVRSDLSTCSGLPRYKTKWAEHLAHLGSGLDDVVGDWAAFGNAYKLRHKLIHGERGHAGGHYAKTRIKTILSASAAVAAFAESHGHPINRRLPVRRKTRSDE